MSAVATPDLQPVEAGFPSEPTDGMPSAQLDAMPETSDSLIPDDGSLGELALPPDAPAEDPAITELRTNWEAEFRPKVEAELNARFQQEFNTLRTTKDRETAAAQSMAASHIERERFFLSEMVNVLQEFGVDPQQAGPRIELMIGRADRAQANAARQQQSTVNVTQGIQSWVDQRFSERNQAAQQEGLPALDRADPEVASWHQWMQQNINAYGAAADRALHSQVATKTDVDALLALQTAGQQLAQFETAKRRQLLSNQTATQQAKVAAEQKAARQRQQDRGPQSTASRGGAAALDSEAAYQQALKEFPDGRDAQKRWQRWQQLDPTNPNNAR